MEKSLTTEQILDRSLEYAILIYKQEGEDKETLLKQFNGKKVELVKYLRERELSKVRGTGIRNDKKKDETTAPMPAQEQSTVPVSEQIHEPSDKQAIEAVSESKEQIIEGNVIPTEGHFDKFDTKGGKKFSNLYITPEEHPKSEPVQAQSVEPEPEPEIKPEIVIEVRPSVADNQIVPEITVSAEAKIEQDIKHSEKTMVLETKNERQSEPLPQEQPNPEPEKKERVTLITEPPIMRRGKSKKKPDPNQISLF